jgi:hypothetical protein
LIEPLTQLCVLRVGVFNVLYNYLYYIIKFSFAKLKMGFC